ncbi:hypothetical protein LCGC14_3061560 [marine sediment metagenome]|uniref:DNA-directed DNA polymerase family A palm domain-containing protein n=1 Tax=marine sediment metagenome TaxID=412755 RepID=A0A0F8X6Z4_9ZZZZ
MGRQNLRGKIMATVDLRGSGRSINALAGQGNIRLRKADIYELPLMISLLKILSIRQPDATAFSKSDIDFRIEGNHIYFDRIDGLLPKGLAWVPQSTVAITCLKGMRQVERTFSFVEMLLQTHDSATFQIPLHREDKLPQIAERFNVEIPYDDPLVIPWNVTTSTESWGDCA